MKLPNRLTNSTARDSECLSSNKILLAIAIAVVFILGCSDAVADDMSRAQTLCDDCEVFREQKGGADGFYCTGFIDAYTFYNKTCIPINVTKGQITLVYLKWCRENPNRLHINKGLALSEAINQAFPCK